MRALSIAAGRGPNFISQMIKDKKQPGADNLAQILEHFTQEDSLYVITGLRLSADELELITAVSALSVDSRRVFLEFLETLKDPQENSMPAS